MYGRHDFDNLVLKCFVACLKDNADDAQSTNIFPPTQVIIIITSSIRAYYNLLNRKKDCL